MHFRSRAIDSHGKRFEPSLRNGTAPQLLKQMFCITRRQTHFASFR